MISFDCPVCAKRLSAGDKLVGRTTKCPKCNTPLRVPGTADLGASAPVPAPAPEVISLLPAVSQSPTRAAAVPDIAGDFKNCPFCAERVLAVAKKCKYCRETID